MSEWREVRLGDMLTLQRGFDITKKMQRPGGVPVVSSSGVGSYHDEARAGPPGVVIGRKGLLGSAFFLEQPFWPHDTTLWVKNFKGNDPYFCYLALKNLRLEDLDAGSSNPTLNRNHAHLLPVAIPGVRTQRRIARLLAAFDELIEINERRIELLEDLARSLYREWFVRFRFPGHDDVELVDSELGPIPEGWRVLPTESVLAPIGGGTPSKKCDDYWVGGRIPWFTPSDLTRASRRYVAESESAITGRGLAESGARMFPAGSVLMTSRATLGVFAIATLDSTCNQGFIVIPPVDGIPPSFIYEWLSSRTSELETIATGATFKEITKTAFKRFPFLRPDADILASFQVLMQPLEEEIEICERHNRHLAATRDLLLPRLVTGRLDISELDLGDLLPPEAA